MQTDPTLSSSSEPQATTDTDASLQNRERAARAVAPVKWLGSARVYPDLYNHFPSRMVSAQEAQLKNWVFFYEGQVCPHGHRAPRRVCAPKLCVDCDRRKRNLPPIGQRGTPITKQAKPVGSRRQRMKETDNAFMVALAELKSFDAACVKVGVEAAEMRARVSSFPQLRAAVNDLERRIGSPGETTPVKTGAFEWTEEARAKFVEAYVDTGDIASARDAIGITPSEYYRELERNPAFATAVKSAEPLALRALEERAIQLSLKGNDKLLQKLLAAKMPEQYSERVRLDVKQETTHKLDDRALNARLASLLAKHRNVLDAEFTEISHPGDSGGSSAPLEGSAPRALAGPGGAGPETREKQAEPAVS